MQDASEGFPVKLGAVIGGVCLVSILAIGAAGRRLVAERADQLMRGTARQLVQTRDTAAQLLAERTRDIRTDLEVVVEVSRQHDDLSPEAIALVSSNLTALDRATRNYVRLWYVADGRVLADISGGRATAYVIPDVRHDDLAQLERRAHARPGEVVTLPLPLLTTGAPDRRFRPFALAPRAAGGAVIVLADLDAVFETLQGSTRLISAELWVIDSDLGTLVAPADDPLHPAVVAAITAGEPESAAIVGPQPGLWPFGDDGRSSRQVAWSSRSIEGMRWTIGVATPLAPTVARIHELSERLLMLAGAITLLMASAGGALVLLHRHQLAQAEKAQYEITVARLRDQLVRAEKLSMIGQLASGVAHEIGTPLGVIAIRVDQLVERGAAGRDGAVLSVIKDEIARINRIIQQLLDFSRPRETLARAVPLTAPVQRVRALLEHRYDQKDVDLRIDVDDGSVIRADPDQLEQVLLNLLLNACDACRAHDAVDLIARPSKSSPDRIELEVRDTGTGIAPADLGRIFEPFFTTKAPGAGTGLGLTVAREIVKSHGGDIVVSSSSAGTSIVTSWPSAVLVESPVPVAQRSTS